MPISTSATHQYAMTFVAPVGQAAYPALLALLEQMDQQTVELMQGRPSSSVLLPFHQVASLHYARLFLAAASPEHGDPALLVFSTNYDGPEGDRRRDEPRARLRHIRELVDAAHAGLGKVLTYVGCPVNASKEALVAFLNRPEFQVPTKTFYVGASGRSKKQILAEFRLRKQIELAADLVRVSLPRLKDPEQLRKAIATKLVEMGVELPGPFPPQPDGRVKVVLVAGSVLLGILALFGPLLPFAYFYLRHLEKTDPVDEPRHDARTREHTEQVSVPENLFMQNQLTHLVELKPGAFRYALINAVFFALQLLATNYFNKGKLGNIPSIHFARWFFLGKSKRLLFFSNFDHSWQSYLGDFVDQASSGLTAVWSNTRGYPRTKNLLFAGSRNSTSFLAWTRAHQLKTNVWFSAYPALSIKNINAHTELRRGLANPTAMSATDWLKILGGQDLAALKKPEKPDPRPRAETLPHDDIQGLILQGYGFLPHARYVMLKIVDGRAAARWFSSLPVTSVAAAARHYSEEALRDLCFVNLALTFRGLQALGLDGHLLSGFSAEFAQGSDAPSRSRVLGDDGRNAPENWAWGNRANPVDAVLTLFCRDEAAVERHLTHYRESGASSGIEVVTVLEGRELPGRKEHFGFRDGIAQPRVRAQNDIGHGSRHQLNAMAPGEFLLGYADNYRGVEDEGAANITFAPTAANGFEFSKGGSFLVFRQLEQDVRAFWAYCEEASRAPGSTVTAEELASKMVGRWPNGEPLVLSPDGPRHPEQPSNEDSFGYVHNGDASGEKCPFSAHIRRSNPRDWSLGADTGESMRLANLHRILRRGRPYGPPLADSMTPEALLAAAAGERASTKRGLNFLCFNGNIERQFEFVQQQWVNNTQLSTLLADGDPLMGRPGRATDGIGESEPHFTIQQAPLRQRCAGLSDFVSVRGSAYFLMPPLGALRELPALVGA